MVRVEFCFANIMRNISKLSGFDGVRAMRGDFCIFDSFRSYQDTGIRQRAHCVFLELRRLNAGCVDLTQTSSYLAGAST